jgi:cysteine desulfurase / selenocysteine lyase
MNRIVYFDNAATSFPKPEEVYRAVDHYQREIGAAPGRSGHRLGVAAGRTVFDARERLASLFNVPDSSRIIFTANCTDALNLAIKGSVRAGDHVVTSSIEHNSVMRPLRRLESDGIIELTVVRCSREGLIDPGDVEKAIKSNTRLVVVTHASNVVGTIQPVAEVGAVARKRGVRLVVDAAQSAGCMPINVPDLRADLFAFSGHKGLLGPQGTGGLVIADNVDLVPLKEGGTGSNSQQENQPTQLPDRYESGTLNGPGIAGLAAGVAYVQQQGAAVIQERLRTLTALLLDELVRTPGATMYGPRDPSKQTAVVSFTMLGMDTARVSVVLDDRFGILTRAGLPCSPAAHSAQGTRHETGGTVRVSLGCFNTIDEVRYFGDSIREIQSKGL